MRFAHDFRSHQHAAVFSPRMGLSYMFLHDQKSLDIIIEFL